MVNAIDMCVEYNLNTLFMMCIDYNYKEKLIYKIMKGICTDEIKESIKKGECISEKEVLEILSNESFKDKINGVFKNILQKGESISIESDDNIKVFYIDKFYYYFLQLNDNSLFFLGANKKLTKVFNEIENIFIKNIGLDVNGVRMINTMNVLEKFISFIISSENELMNAKFDMRICDFVDEFYTKLFFDKVDVDFRLNLLDIMSCLDNKKMMPDETLNLFARQFSYLTFKRFQIENKTEKGICIDKYDKDTIFSYVFLGNNIFITDFNTSNYVKKKETVNVISDKTKIFNTYRVYRKIEDRSYGNDEYITHKVIEILESMGKVSEYHIRLSYLDKDDKEKVYDSLENSMYYVFNNGEKIKKVDSLDKKMCIEEIYFEGYYYKYFYNSNIDMIILFDVSDKVFEDKPTYINKKYHDKYIVANAFIEMKKNIYGGINWERLIDRDLNNVFDKDSKLNINLNNEGAYFAYCCYRDEIIACKYNGIEEYIGREIIDMNKLESFICVYLMDINYNPAEYEDYFCDDYDMD